MNTIQVRLDGPNETLVRLAAKQMGVQVNRVKHRDDCVQLYGTKIINNENVVDAEFTVHSLKTIAH